MPVPEFILTLREKIGHDELWLSAVTAVVLRDDGNLLLARRADTGAWTSVSGIIDPGEEPADAAEREVLEETDVVAVAERLAWVHATPPMIVTNGDKVQYLDLVFRCRYVSGEPHPADGENLEVGWFPPTALPPMSDHQLARIEEALRDTASTRFERTA